MLVAMVTAPRRPGLGDDLGLLFVIARVQHAVPHLHLLEPRRQGLGLLDADGADEDRLAALAAVLDEAENGVVLLLCRAVDLVVLIDANHRQVGRDRGDVELVDIGELGGLGGGRSGHAGELGVQAEVVLEGDRGERLILLFYRHRFLGLECLVQAFREAPPLHHAPGELVDDDDLVVHDDVVGIACEQLVRPERLVDVMQDGDALDVVEALGGQQPGLGEHRFGMLDTGVSERHRARLLVPSRNPRR